MNNNVLKMEVDVTGMKLFSDLLKLIEKYSDDMPMEFKIELEQLCEREGD